MSTDEKATEWWYQAGTIDAYRAVVQLPEGLTVEQIKKICAKEADRIEVEHDILTTQLETGVESDATH